MSTPAHLNRLLGLDRFDRIAAALVAALGLFTLILIAAPDWEGHWVSPALDLVLDTIATVVAAALASLAWVRQQERHGPISRYEAGAFTVLAIASGIAVAAALAYDDSPSSPTRLMAIGEAQAWVFLVARLLAAGLLLVGGEAALRGARAVGPSVVVIIPAILLLLVGGLAQAQPTLLPTLIAIDPAQTGPTLPDAGPTGLGVVLQIVSAALTMEAALVCRHLWNRDHAVGVGYLALALVIASFAQLHAALFSSVHPSQVATGDLLWLFAEIVLLLAVQAETRSSLAALRTANVNLERLRRAEMDRAALEERARMSRELHDGLAQDLWLAKLKVSRLSAIGKLEHEAAVLASELAAAIDGALGEARHVVSALRLGTDSTSSFRQVLARKVDDFQDRWGVRAELVCPIEPPGFPVRTEAELLRIVREALANVAKHADATVVAVSLAVEESQLVVRIRDNGRGFEPDAVRGQHFGLAMMRERAAALGADLIITSRPLDGSEVIVKVPLPIESKMEAEVAR